MNEHKQIKTKNTRTYQLKHKPNDDHDKIDVFEYNDEINMTYKRKE
jgi:hypothetical protein